MTIKLWIDDVRPAPEWATHWAKTPLEAIDMLKQAVKDKEPVEHIAFDHDMGVDIHGVVLEAKAVVRWMHFNEVYPETFSVHSSNPHGAKWIRDELQRDTKLVDTYPGA